MSEHTATTRHIIDVTVTVPGDDGIDPEYLVDVLMWGLEQHNQAVDEGVPWTGDPDNDHFVEPLIMSVTPDIGLDAENAMVRDTLNPTDPMEMPLSDCMLVIGDTTKRF